MLFLVSEIEAASERAAFQHRARPLFGGRHFRFGRQAPIGRVQLLLGHSKLESTVRYLGIEVDDALEIAEQTEV